MTKGCNSVNRRKSAADESVHPTLAFRLSAIALFAAAAHVAIAAEIPNADVVNPVNLVSTVGGSASSDTKCLNNDNQYGVAKAFDKSYYGDKTRWIGHSSTFPQRAVWTFREATIVDTVRIYNATYSGASNSPSEFTIAGSNDGTSWTTLDEELSVTGWSATQFRTFQFDNSTPYLKYRLQVTKAQGGSRMTITEIELYRVNQASFDVATSGDPTIGVDSFSMDWILTVEENKEARAGIVWSTNETFAIATTNSLGTGLSADTYTASLTGLEPDTTYWWKIYAERDAEIKETIVYSFKTLGAPKLGTATRTLSGETATFSVPLAEAAMINTLATSVSVFYGTDGENWTELPLGSYTTATNLSGTVKSLGYGVTYQWFARATATLEGGRILSADSATKTFTTPWNSDMYVDASSTSASKPYNTPETAATTISAAISAATDGATIHVAPGHYAISSPLEVSAGVRILGDDPDLSRTVVSNTMGTSDANRNKRVFILMHKDALVANLTMQKGEGYESYHGGNFYISSAGGMVSNCVVEAGYVRNNAQGSGAYLDGGIVTHTIFRRNWSGTASQSGLTYRGGLLVANNSARVENCLFAHNDQYRAVRLINMNNTSVMRNCTIVDTSLSVTNAYCASWSPLNIASGATVQNVVIAGVTNTVNGAKCRPTGTQTKFINGALDSSITGTSFPATTVVGTAESFFNDYANGDYTPKTDGPLVNAGTNYNGMASVDLAGKTRKSGKIVDIGCYEFQMGKGFFILVR